MATKSVWLELKKNKIRKITATSLEWKFGRLVTITAMYCTGTAGTNVSIETFTQRLESDPDPANATVPSTAPVKAITVGAENLAFAYLTGSDAANGDPEYQQLTPFLRALSFTVTTPVQQMTVTAQGSLQKILDCDVYDYIRFTGTELPVAGLIFGRKEISGMFTEDPTTIQL